MRQLACSVRTVTVLLLVSACQGSHTGDDMQPVQNKASICKQFNVVSERHNNNSPESREYAKAMQEAYQGKGESSTHLIAEKAYFRAWVRDLGPLVDRTSDPDLKSALRDQVEHFEHRANGDARAGEGDTQALRRITEICANYWPK